MRGDVRVVYLEYTREHEHSGLGVLGAVTKRLFPRRQIRYVVVDNACPQDREIQIAANIDLISGDNTGMEFSGYDKGVRWFESFGDIDTTDPFVIANDTFHRHDGVEYLNGFDARLIGRMEGCGGIAGYIDAFPEPVGLLEYTFQKYVRSSFFILPYGALRRLAPLCFGLDGKQFFREDAGGFFFAPGAPITENYNRFIRTWLFDPPEDGARFRESWRAKRPLSEENVERFRRKAMSIFREHLFSARAQALSIPLIASNERQRTF